MQSHEPVCIRKKKIERGQRLVSRHLELDDVEAVGLLLDCLRLQLQSPFVVGEDSADEVQVLLGLLLDVFVDVFSLSLERADQRT